MSYEQVHTALGRIRKLHESAAEVYRRLGDRTEGGRVRMLLDYLERHEQKLARSLETYARTAPRAIMHTWYQFTPGRRPVQLFKKLDQSQNLTLDELLDLALWFDRWLVDFYQGMRDGAPTASLRETFTSLLRLQREEGHLVARQAFAVHDI